MSVTVHRRGFCALSGCAIGAIAVPSTPVDVAVLGGLEVRRGGLVVGVRGSTSRAVLAVLALRAGDVVLDDELVDALWDGDLPADPTAAIHVAVSRLRAALGDDRAAVRRHRLGYSLDVAATAVDAGRAAAALRDGRDAVQRGDIETAIALLGGALREWRGTPLVEFADLPFAGPASTRLHVLRLALAEARNDVLLEAGRPAEVLDDTPDLLATDPWREELVAQLMLALYRTGRQVDALAAYAQLASALHGDFGVAPSPRVLALHDRIVAHDPSLGRRETPTDAASLPRWFESALQTNATHDGDSVEDVVRARLLLALGEAKHHAGEPGWQDALHDAGVVAQRAGDLVTVARAALAGALGWGVEAGTADARRLALIDHALAADGQLDAALRARLLAARATELAFSAPLADRMAASVDAVRLARAAGEPATVLAVLNQRYQAVWAPETLDDRTRLLDEAGAIASTLGLRAVQATIHGWQMAAAIERADLVAVDQHLASFAELGEQLALPVFQWGAVLHASWRAVVDGDLDRASLLCEEAERVGIRIGRPEAPVVATMQRVALAWASGTLGAMVDVVAAVAATLPDLRALDAFHALALHDAGDPIGAAAHLRGARDSLERLPRNAMFLATLVCWAELAHALGDADAASLIATSLRPYEPQFVFTGAAVFGPVAHALGLLDLTTGDVGRAADDFAAATRLADSMPSPFFAGRARAAAVTAR
jgi:DNA-binding SARP family transcriptional activator